MNAISIPTVVGATIGSAISYKVASSSSMLLALFHRISAHHSPHYSGIPYSSYTTYKLGIFRNRTFRFYVICYTPMITNLIAGASFGGSLGNLIHKVYKIAKNDNDEINMKKSSIPTVAGVTVGGIVGYGIAAYDNTILDAAQIGGTFFALLFSAFFYSAPIMPKQFIWEMSKIMAIKIVTHSVIGMSLGGSLGYTGHKVYILANRYWPK